MQYEPFIKYYDRVVRALRSIPYDQIVKATQLIKQTQALGKKVYLVGNGGSAATSIHFAGDLNKVCGIDAIAIPSQLSTVFAYGNDTGWEYMFANYLKSVVKEFDLLIAISCSGASENIIQAVKYAIEYGGRVISFTGQNSPKNKLAVVTEERGIAISVQDYDIKVQEDVHLIICHSIIGALQK